MNTWTDSGMSEAGLVGAMLALGLDTAPTRDANPARNIAPAAAARVPADVAIRSLGSAGTTGRGRFPAPERSAPRTPSSFPPPPLPEPKLASDDLSGWTDGFLAGGSPLSAPASWDEPSSASAPDDRAPQPAELTSMLDCLLDPGRAPGRSAPAAPAVPGPAVPGPAGSGPAGPALAGTAPLESRPSHLDPHRPSGPSTPSMPSAPPAPGVAAGGASSHVPAPEAPSGRSVAAPAGVGSGPDSPLDGPLDVAELEPAQLDFEFAPLDPDALEPTLLEPTPPGVDRPAEEPSLAELTGLDRPGLGPVVLGALGLESMDLDASSFAVSPEFPPPTEPAAPAPAAAAAPAVEPESGPESGPAPEPVEPAEPGAELPEAPGGAHRRTDPAAEPRRAGGAHHRRNEMSPLSSLDDSPLYSTLSPRQD